MLIHLKTDSVWGRCGQRVDVRDDIAERIIAQGAAAKVDTPKKRASTKAGQSNSPKRRGPGRPPKHEKAQEAEA